MAGEGFAMDVQVQRTYVGQAFHYFSRLGVVAVSVSSGCVVRKGDRLQYGRHTRQPWEEEVSSMEFDHTQIEEARGPKNVGIEVSRRIEPGTPVYLVPS